MNKQIQLDSARHIIEFLGIQPDDWSSSEQQDNSYIFFQETTSVKLYVWVLEDTGQVYVSLVNGINSRELELIFPNEELMKLPYMVFKYIYDNPGEGLLQEIITFSDRGIITNIETIFRREGREVKVAEPQMKDIWIQRLDMRDKKIIDPLKTFKESLEYFLQKETNQIFVIIFKK